MKLNKLIAGLGLLAAMAGISSCSEDFEVAAPYKDVTVVYGFLNPDEPAQYIRIEKASMDENQSAVNLAQNPDSNYYRSLEVRVREINGGNVVNDDVINRVDMATENLPKDPGTYFQSPSYAYKYTRTLVPGHTYRLVVKNLETGRVDSAQTDVLSNNFNVVLFNQLNPTLDFANTVVNNNFLLNVNVPSGGRYMEGYIRIKYATSVNGGPQVDSSLLWRFASQTYDPSSSTTTSVNLTVSRQDFYSFLNANIKPSTGVARYLDSSDVYIWVANQDFYNYMLINSTQGGITADQIKASYTNIKGEAALGLFSSRSVRVRYNIPFTQTTLDSIRRDKFTSNLNFIGFANH